jgi:NitT/TauT family transport system substrate-binding protein
MTVDLAITEADPLRPSRLMKALDYGVKLPGNGLYVSEDSIATKRDVLVRFLRVSAEALRYVYDGHAEEAAEAIRKQEPDTKLGVELLKKQIDMFGSLRFLPETEDKPTGWQSPEEWQARVQYMKAAHLLTGDHAPTEFYTNELLEAGAK